jgi:ribosomal protein S12 methylthiotransferase
MRGAAPRIGFVSLGCPKALVDSERILTRLCAEGYETVETHEDADLVVVNTCGFITDAVRESLDAIGEALDRNGKVIVTGCLGAQPQKIRALHPKVLAITGPHAYETVVKAIHEHLPPAHDPVRGARGSLPRAVRGARGSLPRAFLDLVPGIKLTPRHYAYLKISEGCNHRCSFCVIPSLRGDLASRPIGEVLDEAERLVRAGVKELLVISQDTSAYGVDLRHRADAWRGERLRTHLVDLARGLGELGVWVRLHYVYPYPHVDELIPLMAEGKVLPYLDVPFQHASPRVLRRMRRPARAADTLERIRRWREVAPDLAIRSTFIVGFPGETEADFEELLAWLDAAQLDRVGCFPYSPVEGAAANALPDPVPDEVKQERWERFMERAARISAQRLAAKVGRRLRVLVDSVGDGVAIARSTADAPEIDGVVRVRSARALRPGEWADVLVTAADTYDLEARA